MGEDTEIYKKKWWHNVETWLHGLVSAAIGGGSAAVAALVVTPETVNLKDGLHKLLELFLASAIVGVALFLKQSPVPQLPDAPEPQYQPPKPPTAPGSN